MRTQNRIKGLCRRHAIKYRGRGIYRGKSRPGVLEQCPNPSIRWPFASLYRQYDFHREERLRERNAFRNLARKEARFAVKRLRTIPGVGEMVALTVVGWIVDPKRFATRNKLSWYGGLGVRQNVSNWKPAGAARASSRGNRQLKRVLFLAARAAVLGYRQNALARRYRKHPEMGWEARPAIRDIARKILNLICLLWRKGGTYRDELVAVPR